MNFDIEEYLTEEDKKRIAQEVFRGYVSKQLNTETDLQRFISNTAYKLVSDHCDTLLTTSMESLLKSNVTKVVNGLTEYTVFRKPNVWDDGTNGMYNFLAQCLDEHKPRIKEIVAERVDKESLETIKGEMKHLVVEAVQNIYKEI